MSNETYVPPCWMEYGDKCPRCGDTAKCERVIIGTMVGTCMHTWFDYHHGICKECRDSILRFVHQGNLFQVKGQAVNGDSQMKEQKP